MSEMSRPVAVERIGAAGLEQSVAATEAELGLIATRLLIPSVRALDCSFRLRRLPEGVIAAEGTLAARVVQTCVVSLEEFEQAVSDRFEVHFVPEGTESTDDDLEAPDQIGYAEGAIDLGEAAVQQLALALDPYPRKPGAEPAAPLDEASGPFAALRRKQ